MDATTHPGDFPRSRGPWWNQAFEVTDSYCPGDYDLSIQTGKLPGLRSAA